MIILMEGQTLPKHGSKHVVRKPRRKPTKPKGK